MDDDGGSIDRADAELWKMARQYDPLAFAELFDRHQTRVYQHCLARTGSRASAEDLVSMAFLETWRLRDQVDVIDSLAPWLLAVSNNLILNYKRSERRYRQMLARLPPPSYVSHSVEEAAVNAADGRRSLRSVERALRKLRPEDRDVVRLCALAGVSYEAAAELLDLPVGTVKSRLTRARDRLRGALETAEGIGPGHSPVANGEL